MDDCRFPHLGPDCRSTYADYLGTPYRVYHGVFLTMSLVTWLLVSFENAKFWYRLRTATVEKPTFKKLYLGILWVMSFCLFISMIDPLGYSGRVAPFAETYAANLCTLLGLYLVVAVTLAIVRVALRRPFPRWMNMAIVGVGVAVWVVMTVMVALQVGGNRARNRGIKLLIYAVTMVLVTISLNLVVRRLIKLLSGFDETMIAQVTDRLKRYLFSFDAFAAAVVIYQLSAGCRSLASQNSREPHLTTDAFIFPITQLIGIWLALAYIGKVARRCHSPTQLVEPINPPLHPLVASINSPADRLTDSLAMRVVIGDEVVDTEGHAVSEAGARAFSAPSPTDHQPVV